MTVLLPPSTATTSSFGDLSHEVQVTDAPATVERVRIAAADLSVARAERAGLRRDLLDAGRNPDEIAVLVDLYVHVADDARTARSDVASAAPPAAGSLTYIGTEHGLAGLISDIRSADVADGVTLITLIPLLPAASWAPGFPYPM